MASNLETALNFLHGVIAEQITSKFAVETIVATTDTGASISLPVYDAADIFQAQPENAPRTPSQQEAIDVWNQTGLLLIRDFLPESIINSLHEHAMAKIASGADRGDHFRSTTIKHGYEGRGWAQRAALMKTSPELLGAVLGPSKQLQQLVFGSMATTTEVQFNATYSDDIGHIHIDRPAGFLSATEAAYIDPGLLHSMNHLSFQTAFYTADTPRSKGSTGFIPGSHRILSEAKINSINLYASDVGKAELAKLMFHGDIPKNVAIAFQSAVLHRTGSNTSQSTRVAYLIQNQLASLVRMEGNMFDSKLAELAIMYDVAYENIWCFNELYDNYPFPANLSDIANSPEPGSLAPSTLSQRITRLGREKMKNMSIADRVTFFRRSLETLHGVANK